MDLVVVTKVFPKQGETIMGDSFFTNPGGKGANQAVAIAKMGSSVEMVGAVGQEFGDELVSQLQTYNVSTKYVRKHKGVSSGTATIIIYNGDNHIILNPAANYHIEKVDIDQALSEAEEGDYLLCQLEIPLNIVEYALAKAKEKKMITFLNPAPYAQLPKQVFRNSDYLMPNQTETEQYTGVYPKDFDQARLAAQKFIDYGVKNVVITMGEQGAYYYDGKNEFCRTALEVSTIDTTGAGDAYIGTFITMLSENKTIVQAMDLAGLAAGITIQRLGAQKAIPYRHEIEIKS